MAKLRIARSLDLDFIYIHGDPKDLNEETTLQAEDETTHQQDLPFEENTKANEEVQVINGSKMKKKQQSQPHIIVSSPDLVAEISPFPSYGIKARIATKN